MDKVPAPKAKLRPYSFLASALLAMALLGLREGRTGLPLLPQRPETCQKHKLNHDASSLPTKMVLPFSTSYSFLSLSDFFPRLRLPWRLL